jgi:hypothetical protein
VAEVKRTLAEECQELCDAVVQLFRVLFVPIRDLLRSPWFVLAVFILGVILLIIGIIVELGK